MKVQADINWNETTGEIGITIGKVPIVLETPPFYQGDRRQYLDHTLVMMGVRQPATDGSAVEIHKVPPSGGERKKHGRRGRRGS